MYIRFRYTTLKGTCKYNTIYVNNIKTKLLIYINYLYIYIVIYLLSI